MGGHGHHHGPGRRSGRLFDYGELRLLMLAMIAERPRRGYEIIKEIEERFAGHYSPSPGVVYPTLSWLEDMGYIVVEADSNRSKLSRITPEGEAFLTANRAAADELLTREAPSGPPEGGPMGGPMGGPGGRGGRGRRAMPEEIAEAMEGFRQALHDRLAAAPDDAAAGEIAEAIRAATRALRPQD